MPWQLDRQPGQGMVGKWETGWLAYGGKFGGGGLAATTMRQQPAKVSQAKPNNARLSAPKESNKRKTRMSFYDLKYLIKND